MIPDKNTLQFQLDRLLADNQILVDNIRQRQETVQKLNIEIEQHRGAHAYNVQLTEAAKKQLADLAASSPTT